MLSRAFITGRMCGVGCFVRTTRVGGSGSCGILRWCRLRFGRRDLASSFFPCEFFNAPVALGFVQCRLLAGDFSAPASDCCPLPYSLDDRWGVVCTGERGGGFPTSGMCFRVGVGRFFGLWAKEEVEEGFLPVDVIFGLASVAFR